MGKEMFNTREVAEYLGIHEKQVYALIKAGKIPCTRVTGKWLFPKKLIDDWIESDSQQSINQAREKSKKIKGALLASGSNDPVLDILLTNLKRDHPEFYIFTANIGSTDGLKALKEGGTDIAWTHLLDPKTGEYNIPYLSTYLPEMKIAVVNLFYRELGLLVSQKNANTITKIEDIADNPVRFVNRQPGSGTRILLDYYIDKLGIKTDDIDGYSNEVFTHFEVGLSILSGEADCGIATVAISKLLNVPFYPLVRESFDMVLSQETFFQDGLQAFIDTLKSDNFKNRVRPLGNYDFNDSGKIIYSSG